MDYVILEKHGTPINMNINYDATINNQKKVLICYLPTDEYEHVTREKVYHTNKVERYQIIKSFIKKNYCIDVCHCLDEKAIGKLSSERYDVIFGMGTAYKQAIKKWPDAVHIIYYTESPFWYSKQQESLRIQMFCEKTGIHKKLVRTDVFYHEDDEKEADAIICMCDENLFYKLEKPIYRITPHGLKSIGIDKNLFEKRDERHFLVFGTVGYVHKGIDLLIDVFKNHPDWHLHICGDATEMNRDGYEYHYQNICMEGFLSVNDVRYRELVEQCMFIVLASCAEATPSGVITGMRHGLIPIVSKKLGMEYCGEDKVFFFEELSEQCIEERIQHCVEIGREVLRNMSDSIYQYANTEFTIETYTSKMDYCIDSILADLFENE